VEGKLEHQIAEKSRPKRQGEYATFAREKREKGKQHLTKGGCIHATARNDFKKKGEGLLWARGEGKSDERKGGSER